MRQTTSFNLDKTFCASPHCKNECGRKPPDEYLKRMWENPKAYSGKLLSFAYFCGEEEKTTKE